MYALQLLLQCGRTCPALCQAAVLAGAPEALLALGLRDSGSGGGGGGGGGSNGALALLALTAILEGLHSRRGAAGGGTGSAAAAQNALTPGGATDDALRRLAGESGAVRCERWRPRARVCVPIYVGLMPQHLLTPENERNDSICMRLQ